MFSDGQQWRCPIVLSQVYGFSVCDYHVVCHNYPAASSCVLGTEYVTITLVLFALCYCYSGALAYVGNLPSFYVHEVNSCFMG